MLSRLASADTGSRDPLAVGGSLCCGSSRSAGAGPDFGGPESLDLAVSDTAGRGAVRADRGDGWSRSPRCSERSAIRVRGGFVYASSRSLTGAAAGLIAIELERWRLSRRFLPPQLPLRVCTQVLDLAFAAIVFTLRGHGSPRSRSAKMAPLSLTALPLYVPGVALLAFGYQRFPPGCFLCSSLRRLPLRDRSCSTKRSADSQVISRR